MSERTLEDVFERIYLINLRNRPERIDKTERVLLDSGLVRNADAIRRVDAVNGKKVGIPAWWTAGPGAWGCLASHSKIVWEASNDGIESYFVCEDDLVTHEGSLTIFNEAIEEAGTSWDQFYWGGQFQGPPEEIEGKRWLLKPRNVNRTHAFALRHTGFQRFGSHIWHAPDYIQAVRERRKEGWHVDDQLGLAHERNQWRTRAPRFWVFGQAAGESDICDDSLPEKWWHWDRWRSKLPVVWIPTAWTPDELGPELSKQLFFGEKNVPGKLRDGGLTWVFKAKTPEERISRLEDHLLFVAHYALNGRQLPAVQHPALTREMLDEVWGAGKILTPEQIEPDDLRYPFAGRFAWNPRKEE